MTGIADFNAPAFDVAAARLRGAGYEVFNPPERDRVMGLTIDGATGDEPYDRRQVLAADLEWLCLHAEGLAYLPGAEASSGARAEMAAARAIPVPVMYWKLWLETGDE